VTGKNANIVYESAICVKKSIAGLDQLKANTGAMELTVAQIVILKCAVGVIIPEIIIVGLDINIKVDTTHLVKIDLNFTDM